MEDTKQKIEHKIEFLTMEEAAQTLRITKPTIIEWSKTKGLRSYKIGRRRLYRLDDITDFVNNNIRTNFYK